MQHAWYLVSHLFVSWEHQRHFPHVGFWRQDLPDGISTWRVKPPVHQLVLPCQCKCSSVGSGVFHDVHVYGFGWPLLHLLCVHVKVCPAEVSPSTAPEQSSTQRRSMRQKTVCSICVVTCPSQCVSKQPVPRALPSWHVGKVAFHPSDPRPPSTRGCRVSELLRSPFPVASRPVLHHIAQPVRVLARLGRSHVDTPRSK